MKEIEKKLLQEIEGLICNIRDKAVNKKDISTLENDLVCIEDILYDLRSGNIEHTINGVNNFKTRL